MLQNARVTALTVSELLKKNQQGEVKLPKIRAKNDSENPKKKKRKN